MLIRVGVEGKRMTNDDLKHAIPETIHWHPASEKPDTDTAVLICNPNGDEPVWLGYWDSGDEVWRALDGERVGDNIVTHWSHIPNGPKP